MPGRNERCPCGSGVKYKRCCLELDGRADAVGRALTRLGERAWSRFPDECSAAFEECYEAGTAEFGALGPDDHEYARAEAWLLFDRSLCDGRTAVELLRGGLPGGTEVDLLARSSLRAWRVEWPDVPGFVRCRCPLTGEEVRLRHAGDRDTSQPEKGLHRLLGRVVIGRTVVLGQGTVALYGPTLVDHDALVDWLSLADERFGAHPEPFSFWACYGGELLRAALTWPEERVHTIEGDIVQGAHDARAVADVAAVIEALGADPELEERAAPANSSEVRIWDWSTPSGAAARRRPAAERGARWRLAREDAGERSEIARFELDDEAWLWAFAPTQRRLVRAEQRLRKRLGPLLGERTSSGIDRPDVLPRWKRDRLERVRATLERLIPADAEAPLREAA